jgi:hypothetical protein
MREKKREGRGKVVFLPRVCKEKRKEREKRYYAFDTHKRSCWSNKVWKFLRQGEREMVVMVMACHYGGQR